MMTIIIQRWDGELNSHFYFSFYIASSLTGPVHFIKTLSLTSRINPFRHSAQWSRWPEWEECPLKFVDPPVPPHLYAPSTVAPPLALIPLPERTTPAALSLSRFLPFFVSTPFLSLLLSDLVVFHSNTTWLPYLLCFKLTSYLQWLVTTNQPVEKIHSLLAKVKEKIHSKTHC